MSVLVPAEPELSPTAFGSPAEAVIRCENLCVQYEGLLALDRVSLELHPGDLLGLVGPNGAGKTTLLRALAGLQPPTAGAAWILGQRTDLGDGEAMRHVGFTADEPPVYEQMTVRQFLRFIARGYGSSGSEVDERIDFWLDQVWLTQKADQKIDALSRGMRQRIGIARTLLPNPAAILLDEPAAGLDPAGRAQFRQLLMSLRSQGKALIVSSHILSDLSEYCSHIAIMARGRVVRLGTVDQISDEGSETTVYMARFAQQGEDLLARLRNIEGILEVADEKGKVRLTAPAGDESAARLIAAMVEAKLPLCGFSADAGGLERAYLRSGIGQVD